MKFRWIFLLGINLVNSLYMAFILVTMFANKPHQILLIEPNNLVIYRRSLHFGTYSDANFFGNNLELLKKS